MKESPARSASTSTPRCSGLRVLFVLLPLLAPVCCSGCDLAPSLRPYLNLSWDAGRDNDEYDFDPVSPGPTKFIYRGVSVQLGIRYRPLDWPLVLDFSVLKGFTFDPIPDYMRYARPGVYAAVDAALVMHPLGRGVLSAGVSYLNDFLHWDHYVLAGNFQGTARSGLIAWSALAGGAWEFRHFSNVTFDRPLLLVAGQASLQLWLIRPYLSAGYVWRLTQGRYDSGPWVHPPWSAGFVSLGLQLQSDSADLSGLIYRMTAPKLWSYGGPD